MTRVIDDAAGELNITLTDEQKQMIRELMEKIANLDLNVEDLKAQVQGNYDKLDEMGIHISRRTGAGIFLHKLVSGFSDIWNQITGWFSSIFG